MCTSVAGHSATVTKTTRGTGKVITLVFGHDRAKVLVSGKDGVITGDAAGKLSGGGGGDVCVNARIVADRHLGDIADGAMDQIVETKLKDCTLTEDGCVSATAVSGLRRVILSSSGTTQAIVADSGEIPPECPAVPGAG